MKTTSVPSVCFVECSTPGYILHGLQKFIRSGFRNLLTVAVLMTAAVLSGCCGSCGGSSGGSGLTAVPEGSWAGASVGLQVTRTGASVQYGCASGTIDQPMTLDSTGHFDVTGTTVPGSPIANPNNPPASIPTRYTGSTDGQTMTLTTVETTASGPVTNNYTLTFGKQFSGPICVR